MQLAKASLAGKWMAACLLAIAATSGARADADWFAGDGDISDISLWSQDPRKLVVNPDGTVTTNSVWCRFRTSKGGADQYKVTLSEDLGLHAFGWYDRDSDLEVRLDLAPYALSFSETDAVRMIGSPTLWLESGTLSAKKMDGGYGRVVFWENASNATFVVDGPDTVLDGGVNMRGGEFCTAVVTNGGRVTQGANIHGFSNNRLLVTGKGSVVDCAGEQFNVGGSGKQDEVMNGTKSVTNNVARICDGGVVTNVGKSAICGHYGSFSFLDIDGGSLFANDLRVGITPYSSNNVVRIANGARVALGGVKQVSVGESTGCGQTLLFENYANDRNDLAGFTMGKDAGSSNHVVRIVNSVFDVPPSGKFETGGGMNNGIVVSGGSRVTIDLDENGEAAQGAGIVIGGNDGSHGNYLRIEGEGTVVSNFNTNVGVRIGGWEVNPRGALLEVSDGAAFASVGNYVNIGGNVGPTGGGSILRATRGGRIDAMIANLGRHVSKGGMNASNRVEILDGASMEVMNLSVRGWGNTVYVSNGTLRVTNEFYTNYRDEEDDGKNTTLVFAGETPRFEIGGSYHAINREAIFRYEIPMGGYRTIPYERMYANSKIAIKDDTKFEFDLTGFMVSGGKTALMSAPKGITFEHRETVETETTGEDGTVTSSSRIVTTDVTAEQLAKWNVALPEGCALYLSNDAETLVPSKDGKGTVLALRAPRRRFTVIVR